MIELGTVPDARGHFGVYGGMFVPETLMAALHEVVPVTAGQATLKEAINEAMRDWVTNVLTTHYILGSALGSHPYPMMVRDFQRVIGVETRRQILEREERLPDLLVACVGGGSNALGLFHPFLNDESVRLVGVEAGCEGSRSAKQAARCQGGK